MNAVGILLPPLNNTTQHTTMSMNHDPNDNGETELPELRFI